MGKPVASHAAITHAHRSERRISSPLKYAVLFEGVLWRGDIVSANPSTSSLLAAQKLGYLNDFDAFVYTESEEVRITSNDHLGLRGDSALQYAVIIRVPLDDAQRHRGNDGLGRNADQGTSVSESFFGPVELVAQRTQNFRANRLGNGYVNTACDPELEGAFRVATEHERRDVDVGVENDVRVATTGGIPCVFRR